MSKNIKKIQKLEEKMQKLEETLKPLIGKIVYCDGNLFKIKDYSSLYLYGEAYECDKELKVNTDVLFYSLGTSKIYKHFTNKIVNKKFKILHRKFYFFTIIDNIENVYFVDDIKYDNYNTSNFKNDITLINCIEAVHAMTYIMFHGCQLSNFQLSRMTERKEYYLDIRKKYIQKHFFTYSFKKYNKKIKEAISNNKNYSGKGERTITEEEYKNYIKLYEEYLIEIDDDDEDDEEEDDEELQKIEKLKEIQDLINKVKNTNIKKIDISNINNIIDTLNKIFC
jgi:hypothetical protein